MSTDRAPIPEWIETQRLYLRPYRQGEGALLFAAGQRNRGHLSRFESGNFLLQLESESHGETTIQELVDGWVGRKYFFYGIFEKASGDWVGQVYLEPANWDLPAFTLGYIADVEHQRLGYITEAVKAVTQMLFEVLGAHRVQAECNEANIRSWQLLERCGFKREGHLREHKKEPDGSFHGDTIYAMLKSDLQGS